MVFYTQHKNSRYTPQETDTHRHIAFAGLLPQRSKTAWLP
jgi:hypothetical protein